MNPVYAGSNVFGARCTRAGRRSGGHCRRHGRRKQVAPGLPAWHEPCGALRSKTGLHPCFFASARPQKGREDERAGRQPALAPRSLRLRACTRALLTAVLVVQAVTYCATSSTIGDWEDTSVHCAQSFAGKRSTRCLRVNFRTYRSILDIALGQAPSQSISAAVCKLSCLCTTCPLHSPH